MKIGAIGKKIKKIFVFLLLCSLLLSHFSISSFAKNNIHREYTIQELKEIINDLIQWKKRDIGVLEAEPLLSGSLLLDVGSQAADWYAIALGRLGYLDNYQGYLSLLKEDIKKRYKKPGKLDGIKATEWHRISIVIAALGENPEDFATDVNGKPINLIEDGIYNRGKVADIGMQGVNGYIWGLIALDSGNYIIPKDAFYQRDDLIIEILKKQLDDGGFSLDEKAGTSDPDVTAMALQALAPYEQSSKSYEYVDKDNNVVKKTVKEVVSESLECLSSLQLEDGDYKSWGTENVESTAQVIIALCSLNIDFKEDERFIKNNHTVLDGLMKYRQKDGGFLHSFVIDNNNPSANPMKSNSMSGEQVLCALTSLLRFYGGYSTFYDCGKVDEISVFDSTNRNTNPIMVSDKDIKQYEELSKNVSINNYAEIVSLLDKVKKADNRDCYIEMEIQLEKSKEQIENKLLEIDFINQQIAEIVYPLSHVSIKDKKEIKEIIGKINKLDNEDQNQIVGQDDLIRANVKVNSLIRAYVISLILGITIIVIIIILIIRIRRKRKDEERFINSGLCDTNGSSSFERNKYTEC